MPELPEVETIRRGLESVLKKSVVKNTTVFCEKSFIGDPEDLTGRGIYSIRRMGKCLLFVMTGKVTVMVHLRMTGQLIYRGAKDFAGGHPSENFVSELPNKQTRVMMEFEDGGVLYFNDQRKFGFFKVVPTAELINDKFLRSLGPEPWRMDAEEFFERIAKRKGSSIKAVLLDQKVICGLGNIYADEALFESGIDPRRLCGTITEEEAEQLLLAAREVMERSIEAGGSTMATYVKPDGSRGNYLDKFAQVFGREGKECVRCGGEIEKIRVAGRGTHFCPRCQK